MAALPTYQARELLNMSMDALWALPQQRHVVVFDDGQSVTTQTRETVASVYLWALLRDFPDVPIRAEYHLARRDYGGKTLIRVLNDTIWAIEAQHPDVDMEALAHGVLDAVNLLSNDVVRRMSAYVTTISMFDVMEVMDHPKIVEANTDVQPTQYGIEEVAYKKIDSVFSDSTQLKGNPIAEGIRTGTLSRGQVFQSVGPRGFLTDIGSGIFRVPITTGFIEGIGSLYGSMIESRSAAKSLIYNKDLLRSTEFFNRKMQMVSQTVANLHPGDCGTPHTILFPVTKTNLKALRGKWRQTSEGLVKVEGNEKHLIGEDITIRSVLGCVHPDPGGVCEVCYGRLAKSIPAKTNIGHVSASTFGDKITSAVLSTKHLDATSRVDEFQLGPTESTFLTVTDKNDAIYLKRKWRKEKVQVTLYGSEAPNLSTIRRVDVDVLDPTKISTLSRILLTVGDDPDDPDNQHVLQVSLFNRKSSLSRELLQFLSTRVWTQNHQGNVVIDITGFDFQKPFLTLPFTHVNMHENMKYIQGFLHSTVETVKALYKPPKGLQKSKKRQKREDKKTIHPKFLKDYKEDIPKALAATVEISNDKLSVNIVHCEILIYALMVRSSARKDYRLPIPALGGHFETYNQIMDNRSLGAAMAYQNHHAVLLDPGTYIHRKRNDHPYDLVVTGGVVPT